MGGDRVLVHWYELRQGCRMLKLQIADLAFVHNEMNNPSVNYCSSFCQESSWCYWLQSPSTGLPASSFSSQSDPFQSQVRLCYIWPPNPIAASVSPKAKAKVFTGVHRAPPPSPLWSHLLLLWVPCLLAVPQVGLECFPLPLYISRSDLSPPLSLLGCHFEISTCPQTPPMALTHGNHPLPSNSTLPFFFLSTTLITFKNNTWWLLLFHLFSCMTPPHCPTSPHNRLFKGRSLHLLC